MRLIAAGWVMNSLATGRGAIWGGETPPQVRSTTSARTAVAGLIGLV
jgi:altronate dehydratase